MRRLVYKIRCADGTKFYTRSHNEAKTRGKIIETRLEEVETTSPPKTYYDKFFPSYNAKEEV